MPDINVLVDAAQTVYLAWDRCRPLLMLNPQQKTAEQFATAETAETHLRSMGLHDLAHDVSSGRVPLALLQARARGTTLARSIETAPPPQWLSDVLLQHDDPRIRELVQSARNGRLVMTTHTLASAQAITASRPLPAEPGERPGGIPDNDAINLIHALTHGRHLVSAPDNLDTVITRGDLDDLHHTLTQHAGEHLAKMDTTDPYWRVPQQHYEQAQHAKSPQQTWREHKKAHADAYGVDGEDLYMLHQLRQCAAALGEPVTLTTSDYHLAMACAQAGIGPATLYSLEPEGIGSLDLAPHRFIRVRPPQRRFEPQHAYRGR